MNFNPKHFEELFLLEERNYWFVNRNRLILWALQKYGPTMSSFLEVGCGTGYVLSGVREAFPNIRLHATEMFPEGIAFAKTRVPSASFEVADALNLQFANPFDAAGAFDVIEHIEQDEVVLARIHDVLKSSGTLILTVPQHPFLWGEADVQAHHKRRYTREELVRKAERAGFEVIKITSFVSLLFPLMVASRLKNKHNPHFTVTGQMKIHPMLNTPFSTILGLERKLIESGMDFTFGGSLLLVARKR